jgi:hypothetical protein
VTNVYHHTFDIGGSCDWVKFSATYATMKMPTDMEAMPVMVTVLWIVKKRPTRPAKNNNTEPEGVLELFRRACISKIKVC